MAFIISLYLFVQCQRVLERSRAAEVNLEADEFAIGVNVIAGLLFDDGRSYNRTIIVFLS